MTTEESIFFKDYIDTKLLELLSIKSEQEKDKLKIKSFAKRYMQTITGQEYISQSVFRLFLEELEKTSISVLSEATDFDIISLFTDDDSNVGGSDVDCDCDMDEITASDFDIISLFTDDDSNVGGSDVDCDCDMDEITASDIDNLFRE